MYSALVGAHGVGKTSLLDHIRPHTSHYITDGFSRPVKSGMRGMSELVQQQVINELTLWGWENYIDQDVISSRSLLDAIIYTQYYFPQLTTTYLESKFKRRFDEVNFFYIPIEFPLQDDGMRFNNPKDQEKIDKSLQLFLNKNNISFTTLTGSVEDRAKIFLNKLI